MSQASQRPQRSQRSTQRSQDDEYVPAPACNIEQHGYSVGKIIKYLLAAEENSNVILRANIVKHAIVDTDPQFKHIMPVVNDTLNQVFGCELIEFENGKYILVNRLENLSKYFDVPKGKSSRKTLLLVILAHIYMSGSSCTEESVWNLLTKMNIPTTENAVHDHFGNVRQLILEDFVKKRYLILKPVDESDPPKYTFHWGIRAIHEVTEQALLEFISDVFQTPIENLKERYKMMRRQEERQE